MRNVRVTFTCEDNEDSGEEMANPDLVESWGTFLREAFSDFDIDDVVVESATELSRAESQDKDDEEEG
jgi:hypothetical protein